MNLNTTTPQTDDIDPKTELIKLFSGKHFDAHYQSGGHYQSYTTYYINDNLYELLMQLNLHNPSDKKDAYYYDETIFKKRSQCTWIRHTSNTDAMYTIDVAILYDKNNKEHKNILAKLKMILP